MKLERILELSATSSALAESEFKILLPQLSFFIKYGYTKIVEKILSTAAEKPLVVTGDIVTALENGHLDVVQLLFKQGYTIDFPTTAASAFMFSTSSSNKENFYRVLLAALLKGQDRALELVQKYCASIFNIDALMEKALYTEYYNIYTGNRQSLEAVLSIVEK